VATTGCLLSESPLGTPSEGWRFPARNRILVGLADVVVVVESHDTGGSMVTAGLAVDRGAHVLAVPGSIRSPASAGSNRLLGEGAAPACETADILAALSLAGAGAIGGAIADGGAAPSPAGDPRPPPDRRALAVLEAVDWAPTALETVLVRSGLAPAVAAGVLATLEIDGWVRGGGGWWERVGPRLPR
jgi:DNA processing protein